MDKLQPNQVRDTLFVFLEKFTTNLYMNEEGQQDSHRFSYISSNSQIKTKRTKQIPTMDMDVSDEETPDDEKDWKRKPKTNRTKALKTPAAKMTGAQLPKTTTTNAMRTFGDPTTAP